MRRKLGATIEHWIEGGDPRPLLVRGARRTGKTTLVETIGRERFGERFAKLDFQTDPVRTDAIFSGPTDDTDRIVQNISELLRCELHRADSLLFFDEIQLNEKALNSLRFLQRAAGA